MTLPISWISQAYLGLANDSHSAAINVPVSTVYDCVWNVNSGTRLTIRFIANKEIPIYPEASGEGFNGIAIGY